MEKKLSCTKSFNHLKRNLNNENIKSLFISNVKNNIKKLNSNSLNSEKNTSKKNNLYIETKIRGYFNINKKKSCTNKFHTFQNSPLNTFNNNFKCANFNQNKKVNNNSKEKNNFNMYSNNNSYNTNYSNNSKNQLNHRETKLKNLKYNLNFTDLPKKKLHKASLSPKINNFDEYRRYKILEKILNENENDNKFNSNTSSNYYYDKNSKLYNSMSYNSIFSDKKILKKRNEKKINFHNRTEVDKKIKMIPKGKAIKKESNLDININKMNEKYRYNINTNASNNYNHHKLLSLETEKIKHRNNLNSNRVRNYKNEIYKNKTMNNSNGRNSKDDTKIKMIKKLELNEFLNNLKIKKIKKI
jgi:hypothetical protein